MDLHWTWVAERLERGVCEATGLSFDYRKWPHGQNPLAPSLDQKKPGRGYTPHNTQVVCVAYNRAKGEWGEGVLLTLCRAVLRRHGEL